MKDDKSGTVREAPCRFCYSGSADVAEWYYNGIAGIQALEPGFKKVRIRPWLPPSINEMTCTFASASGRISVSMQRNGMEIRLDAKADRDIVAG